MNLPVPIKSLLMAAVALTLTTGCQNTPELEDPTNYSVVIGERELYTEPVEFHEDLGFHARMAGDSLILSWRNNRSDEVEVHAEDLAFITGPDRENDIFRFTLETINLANFRPLVLNSGQKGVMVVEPRVPFPLRGYRIAYFNQRQNLMARADIQ